MRKKFFKSAIIVFSLLALSSFSLSAILPVAESKKENTEEVKEPFNNENLKGVDFRNFSNTSSNPYYSTETVSSLGPKFSVLQTRFNPMDVSDYPSDPIFPSNPLTMKRVPDEEHFNPEQYLEWMTVVVKEYLDSLGRIPTRKDVYEFMEKKYVDFPPLELFWLENEIVKLLIPEKVPIDIDPILFERVK
ncbi:hypothetical protein [Mycoplasmopsis agassizii]|uniref:Uncharacterized protein n=1 Tax=Mycoplasmopsis agassizii TaxID=33922 RepID=A0ABX4H5N4_9BACT|nr:hypothetical protein [Mycoplasmopsis agassizii]PAF55210.1 hypothetical protein CJF60_00795 [Mycoplasmopsis agassizii]SMC18800.1 hypothetical protein SAMN02745179_00773 [Mycoplasmopsis agassizii]